jgi:uncharacterized alpha-E superfamily protein
MLLSRVADRLYWGARYVERTQGTARIVRTYTELMVDLPTSVLTSWEPLLAVAGGEVAFELARGGATDEASIVGFLLADLTNPGSMAVSVIQARENLRTTREIVPREAWQTLNDLHHYVAANVDSGCNRANRGRFLDRVIGECQQLDGVLATVMLRDEAHEIWQLGEALERADMTTRVVGVRAAALLVADRAADEHSEARSDYDARHAYDDVQWMGILRSVSALQMYQRAHRGAIDARSAVEFLLLDPRFPRSVAACTQRIRQCLGRLPQPARTLPSVDALDAVLGDAVGRADDGAALDAAMDEVQAALATVHDTVTRAFLPGTIAPGSA